MAPVRILYDLTVLASGFRRKSSRAGIHRYALELFRALSAKGSNELAAYSAEPFDTLRALAQERVDPSAWDGTPLQRLVHGLSRRSGSFPGWSRLLSGADEWLKGPEGSVPEKRLAAYDCWFSPHCLHFPRGVWNGTPGVRMATVHDLLPLDHPEWFAGTDTSDMLRFFERAERCGIHIATVSRFVLKGILDRGYPADRVHLVHGAADAKLFRPVGEAQVAQALERSGVRPGTPYFVVLNTLEPRKNVEAAFRFFGAACRAGLPEDVLLLVAGAKGWKLDDVEERARTVGCGGRIRMLGYVSDDQLPGLLSGAYGLLYPSLGEGFGLPPLEAMCCGIPAVASNRDSLPEVVGEGGMLLDPLDEDAWTRALLDLAASPRLRESISKQALVAAGRFSWDASAEALLEAMRAAGAGRLGAKTAAVRR